MQFFHGDNIVDSANLTYVRVNKENIVELQNIQTHTNFSTPRNYELYIFASYAPLYADHQHTHSFWIFGEAMFRDFIFCQILIT